MSCADICLSHDYDGDSAFSSMKWVRARKAHTCCECGEAIAVGTEYERVSGKGDGMFFSDATCAICAEVRAAFVCGTWVLGMLWESMREEMFYAWKRIGPWDCLAKLTTDAAVAKCSAEYKDWLGDDEVTTALTPPTTEPTR